FDASDLSQELYNSNQAAGGVDHVGAGNKYIVPTVVNGKVYVGTTNSVSVFGLACSFSLLPTAMTVPPVGGAQSATLIGSDGCPWTSTSNVPWITITSGAAGAGNGAVTFSVSSNTSGVSRAGTLVVAGRTLTINQATVLGTAS